MRDEYISEQENRNYLRLFFIAVDRVLTGHPQLQEKVYRMTEPLIKLPSVVEDEFGEKIDFLFITKPSAKLNHVFLRYPPAEGFKIFIIHHFYAHAIADNFSSRAAIILIKIALAAMILCTSSLTNSRPSSSVKVSVNVSCSSIFVRIDSSHRSVL